MRPNEWLTIVSGGVRIAGVRAKLGGGA
jgi:hypothetical protein